MQLYHTLEVILMCTKAWTLLRWITIYTKASWWLENRLQEHCQAHLGLLVFWDKVYSMSSCMVILKEMALTIKVMNPTFNSFKYDCMECIWDLPLPLKNMLTKSDSSFPALFSDQCLDPIYSASGSPALLPPL